MDKNKSEVRSQRSEVLGLGALNMDYLFRVEEFVIDGETFIKEFHKSPGGSAANTIRLLSQLGISSSFFGVLGDDQDGDLIEESLVKQGVRLFVRRFPEPTGRAFVFVDNSGRRSIYVLPGANLRLGDIDYPPIEKLITGRYNTLVHATSLAGERAFERQKEWILKLPGNIKLSFSPGMLYVRYGLKRLEPLLKRTTILFLNKEELRLLIPSKELKQAVKRLHGIGPEFVSVTLGRKGALLSFKGEFHHQESLVDTVKDEGSPKNRKIFLDNTMVVDTTGAGDAFSAGVLYGVLKGLSLKECGLVGSFLAAKVLRTWGGQIEISEQEIKTHTPSTSL